MDCSQILTAESMELKLGADINEIGTWTGLTQVLTK